MYSPSQLIPQEPAVGPGVGLLKNRSKQQTNKKKSGIFYKHFVQLTTNKYISIDQSFDRGARLEPPGHHS